MRRYLIVDAGGTKTDWVMTESDGNSATVIGRCQCGGINAMLTRKESVREIMLEAHGELPELKPDTIYFYGAGCATPDACGKIASALSEFWPETECEVRSDMLGAARGMLGHTKGIACILGTGSNSCLYDGNSIIESIPSLGFILGDEGSGASLGKRLLTDVLKRQLPEYLCEEFYKNFDVDTASVLENVYHRPEANRYLASFVPFLAQRLLDPYVYQLVLKEFTRFVKRNVLPYQGAGSLPIAFTGSVSLHFEKILREAASQVGVSIKSITGSPLESLVAYHL